MLSSVEDENRSKTLEPGVCCQSFVDRPIKKGVIGKKSYSNIGDILKEIISIKK